MNLFQKILNRQGVQTHEGALIIHPDQVLTHDATGTLIFLQLEAIGIKRVVPFTVVYVDHNMLQVGFRNADDHLYLRGTAHKFGALLSKAGNGICHQVHLENFAKPGMILLGSDSHTPMSGALGMLAIGAGGLDIAAAMAGEPFHLPTPKIICVRLQGRLPAWSSGKDVILHLLETVTVMGGTGRIFEFSGPGVETLSVFDRATICNMGAETGATTSLFPSDEQARSYLRSFAREKDWFELTADSDAVYDEKIDVDLSAIEPLIALPHSPDHVRKVSEVEGLPVNQIGIGSCTNSSYKDLMVAAEILKNRSVHRDVSVVVSPGSRRTLARFSSDGGLDHLIKAGVRVLENTCGPCNGIGQSPESNGVSLRTYNRNFKGRSGTNDARVYLASPETAAVSALFGRITDPRKFGRYPEISLPDSFPQIPNMFIWPADDPEPVEIVRGPNIQPIPVGASLPGHLEFPVEMKLGDGITTDHILPGGVEMLSLRSNIPASIPYVFNCVDPDFAARVDALPQNWAVVAGENYGQGSAREHAVMAPMSIGMKVVIAKSFARIYRQNMINNGVIPLVFKNATDYESIQKHDLLFIDQLIEQIQKGRILVENRSRGSTFETILYLTSRERELIIEGGLLSNLRRKSSKKE
ncbi:MAG: aconitate hydratase [Syntrophales bacterium]|nr:aconitate hydratase [Syntrophales bacterium]